MNAFFERAAAHAGLPFVALDPPPGGDDPVDVEAARSLSPWAARALDAIPIGRDGRALVVAFTNPTEDALATARSLVPRPVRPVLAAPDAMARAHTRVYGPQLAVEPRSPLLLRPAGRRISATSRAAPRCRTSTSTRAGSTPQPRRSSRRASHGSSA